MLQKSDWAFVGKPAWKTVDPKAEVKVNRWVKTFSEKKPGEHLTIYEPKAFQLLLGWCKENKVPHEVTAFRGGGWRLERL